MQSILIVGGDFQKREEKIKKLIRNQKVSHIDLFTLKENGSIGIEKIRELIHWSFQKPYAGKGKVALIPKAEKLTLTAQNALLKLLEEPPQNTLIILAAPQREFLLPTVVSRCRIVKLKPKVEIKWDESILNSQFSILNSLLKSGVGERLLKAEKIAKTREETILFLDQLIFSLREILLEKYRILKRQTRRGQISEQMSSLPVGKKEIAATIKKALRTKKMVEKNVNFKLALENFFLDLPSLR